MNLISKKDLLAQTGISYGQLYRWKRQGLIPEEWFIKQSAYTGQETFFPREQALSRVRSILEMKDRYSMEEMAAVLSPGTAVSLYTVEDLRKLDEFGALAERLPALCGREHLSQVEAAYCAAVVRAAAGLGEDAQAELIQNSVPGISQKNTDALCTVFRAGGGLHAAFTPDIRPPEFDRTIEVLGQVSVSQTMDEIGAKAAVMMKQEGRNA